MFGPQVPVGFGHEKSPVAVIQPTRDYFKIDSLLDGIRCQKMTQAMVSVAGCSGALAGMSQGLFGIVDGNQPTSG